MDLLKILSFGAILLSVSACILVYISHRRTTARLDALTQANLGITSTIHSLISASMAQQSQMNGQGQPQGGSTSQMTGYTSNDNVDNTIMTNQIAERINVSDDDLSDESEEDDESDDDISDGDDADDNEDDDGTVSSDENETDDNLVIGGDSDNTIHIVSLQLDNGSHQNQFSDSHIEELDDIEPDDSDNDITDDDDDDNNEMDDEDLDSIKDADDDIATFSVEKLNEDEDDIAIDELEDNDIMPIPTSKKTTATKNNQQSDDILSKTELFKHLKVDELRKLAIAKHNMTEDEVKKLKKPQLIQRLTQ